MNGNGQHNMECSRFEALLTEAVEASLDTATMQSFRAHASGCPHCGPLFAEAAAGYQALQSLTELEPPAHLLRNILAGTTGLEAAAQSEPLMDRVRGWLRPIVVPMLQPRFAMTAAMAFFTLTLLLNMTGVHITDIKAGDLKPSAIGNTVERQYHSAQASLNRYYDNVRFFYVVESKVRELRDAALEPKQPEQKKQPDSPERQQNQSETPAPEQRDQNYALEHSDALLAGVLISAGGF
jgi:hypothetical protein